MRNLKRALSLLLATVMVIGMMVTGASAASYNDYADKGEIVNKDAVSLLSTLEIMEGNEKGEFLPEVTFTREQMAALVSRIMNRNADNNDLYLGADYGILDLNEAGSWAQGHINYCYSNDIIAGDGLGHFFPKLEVTAVQAAKMLLTALGYDAEIEGLVGEQWMIKTSALASKLGIFDNYKGKINDVLTRDNAALLVYNALDVEMIERYDNNGRYPLVYDDNRTILAAMYGVVKVEGVVTANEWAILDDDTDSALQVGKTRIENPNGIFSTTTSTTVNDDANVRTQVFNVSTPVEMLGHMVTMYIKKDTILANSKVYGEPVISDINHVVESSAKVNGGRVTDSNSLAGLLKGTGMVTDRYTEYYHNYEIQDINDSKTDDVMNVKGAALTVIDYDNDSYVDYVISVEKTLTHVSNTSAKNNTTTLYDVAIIDNEDIYTYTDDVDMTKGAVVLYVQYGGRTYVWNPETVQGEMELFNAKDTDPNKRYIKVEGEKYHEDGLTVKSTTKVATKFLIAECDDKANGVQFDTEYVFYMDDYGNIVAFTKVAGAPTNYALALDSAYSINGLKMDGDIELMLANGDIETYVVDMNATAAAFLAAADKNPADPTDDHAKDTMIEDWYGAAIDTKALAQDAVLKFMGSNDDNHGAAKPTRGKAAGNLVAYSIDEDTETVTFVPANLDSGRYVDGHSTKYSTDTPADDSFFFEYMQTWLDNTAVTNGYKGDLAKGDVDLYLTPARQEVIDTYTHSYGIDEDTIVYYYNGKTANVVKGYDAMAKMISAGKQGAGEIDEDGVYTSVVAFKDDTDVAEVIVLYTSQAKFGDDKFVYVMSVYDKAGSVYTYSVIDEEGNVFTMDSKTPNMAGKLVTYSFDGKYYSLTAQGDCVVGGTETVPAGTTVHNDQGLIITTRTKYFKTYDFVAGSDSTNGVVNDGFTDNINTNWERYADKALVIDVENTDLDDETAATTELTSGQYGIVVYNSDKQALVVYVTDTYKMDKDPSVDDKDNTKLSVTVFDKMGDPDFGKYRFNNMTATTTLPQMQKALEAEFGALGYDVKAIDIRTGEVTVILNGSEVDFMPLNTLGVDSQEELEYALSQNKDVAITGNMTISKNLTVSKEMTIEKGATLTVAAGKTLTTTEGEELVNEGTMVVKGELALADDLSNNGTLVIDGTMSDNGNIWSAYGSTLTINGTKVVGDTGAIFALDKGTEIKVNAGDATTYEIRRTNVAQDDDTTSDKVVTLQNDVTSGIILVKNGLTLKVAGSKTATLTGLEVGTNAKVTNITETTVDGNAVTDGTLSGYVDINANITLTGKNA